MGLPQAKNLQKASFEVVGYDINGATCEQANSEGLPTAASIKDACDDVDFVVTALPKTEHVEKALKMPDGIFDSVPKGAYICDVSTISPVASAGFYKDAKELGINFMDTPMSGGITGAIAGTLTFMVGGEKAEFEHVSPLLKGMGTNLFHCGKPGSGEVAKLSNNLILGINMVATCEGLAIGEKLGLDPKVLMQICSVSSGNSWCMDFYNPVPGNTPTSPANRNWDGGFMCELVKKDLGLAIEAAHTADADTGMGEKAIDYYRTLEKEGFGRKDLGFVYPWLMANRKL